MTTVELEITLMKHLDIRRNLIVPNVTGMSNCPIMFEADILSLSSSNYATGIELKISKGDLKNDIKKAHIKTLELPNYRKYLNVYYKGLKYFYYCVPKELEEEALKQIPSYFGLFICYNKYPYDKRLYIEEVRKPKQLNSYKWSDKERYELARLGSMRIFTLKQKILHLNNFNNINILAVVKYELRNDSDIIRVRCNKNDTDKSIIHEAQCILRSRSNMIHYGNQIWTVESRELI